MKKLSIAIKSTLLSAIFTQPSFADDLETFGDALQLIVPAYSLYASNNLNGRDGLWSCGKAIAYTSLSTHALKTVINAPRPNGGERGFPSGHTSSAAVGFGCMLGQEGWSNTTIALGAASLVTGYSRVESEHHNWEQVVAGFALGTAIGYLSTSHLNEGQSIEYRTLSDGSQSLSFNMEF